MSFDHADSVIHQISSGANQNDGDQHLVHSELRSSGFQYVSYAGSGGDEQFGADYRNPGESEPLLESSENRRQSARQQHPAQQLRAAEHVYGCNFAVAVGDFAQALGSI